MIKRRILFISYNLTKQNLADVIQNNRINALLKERYNVDVLVRSKNKSEFDECVDSINLTALDRLLYKICPSVYPVFSINARIWCRKAFKQIFYKLNNYDLILVPFEPYSVLPLIKKIRKEFPSAIIIALLYDPLANNLFFSNRSNAVKYRNIIEKQLVSLSTKLIVNNGKELSYLYDNYKDDKGKFVYIPLIAQKTYPKINNRAKTTFVHTGSIHGKRKIDELNNAISILKSRIPNLSSILSIELYGRCHDSELAKVANENNDDVIHFKGYVDVTQIGNIYSESDAFILIDPMEKGNFSFPSKLCDYIQYKKPILCIGDDDNPSSMLLNEFNIPNFSMGSSKRIATYIEAIINHNIDKQDLDRLANMFSSRVIANAYYKLFDELIN